MNTFQKVGENVYLWFKSNNKIKIITEKKCLKILVKDYKKLKKTIDKKSTI